jgi:uncharacterized phage protein (TIGR02218 family)
MSWFEEGLTTLAFCWRLERRDGVTIGLTSHDRDLWFGDLLHRAAPGLVPSAIETHRTMDPGSVDLTGALTSDALAEADLVAGLWDGARLLLHAVNWQAPDDEPVFLVRGQLGRVEMSGTGFSVELSGATSRLDRPVTEATSPQCRAALGDERCRVDLRGRRVLARCMSAGEFEVMLDAALPDGRFVLGQLRWLTGPLASWSVLALAQTGARVTLADTVPDGLTGHLVELTEGCDRTLATCTARFDNAANFQGEPHLPGNDLLTRYAI